MSAAPAGAPEPFRERRRRSPLRLSVFVVAALTLTGACTGHDSAPTTLFDGSPIREPSVGLERVRTPVVLTKARVVAVSDVAPASPSADCLQRVRDVKPSGPLVERIGVSGETVTFVGASGLYGCDGSPGPRAESRRWCGSSFGRLYDGHLRDPRLDIAGCRTSDGEPMGFAWIEPDGDARYVAVEQPGYSEVYETAGGLPVRIATTNGVQVEGSRASFRLSQHDASGRLLREYELHAVPAG